MFKSLNKHLQVAQFGQQSANIIYVLREPETTRPIRRVPGSNILIIGNPDPGINQLLTTHSRAEIQQIINLSANAHHQLKLWANGRLPNNPSTTQEIYGYTHTNTGRTGSRIDLLIDSPSGQWDKVPGTNTLAVGINKAHLKGRLESKNQEIKDKMHWSNRTCTAIRRYSGISSSRGGQRIPGQFGNRKIKTVANDKQP